MRNKKYVTNTKSECAISIFGLPLIHESDLTREIKKSEMNDKQRERDLADMDKRKSEMDNKQRERDKNDVEPNEPKKMPPPITDTEIHDTTDTTDTTDSDDEYDDDEKTSSINTQNENFSFVSHLLRKIDI